MRIAIISDIHENFHNLIRALQDMDQRDINQILCLGDLMNAGIAKILAAQEIPCYMIWGNNDGEKADIMRASFRENSSLEVGLNTYDFLELGGKKIFITHYNDLAAPMAETGRYDAIFYGHNHLQKVEKINETFITNPGELSAQKTGNCTYAIYDTSTDKVEIIKLDDIVTLKSDLVKQYLEENRDSLDFRSKDSFT